ncbi:hypothetical protein AAJCM20276_20980 [Acetobacter aceti]|uniref:Uncharacterized protein n=1 Tax=Acetobacter aceti TaxID=435 RepID=A0A6S6PQU4_ACEAC|nr:hypothetical protein AAJCM20276_20980 [Acetobacter aceti]
MLSTANQLPALQKEKRNQTVLCQTEAVQRHCNALQQAGYTFLAVVQRAAAIIGINWRHVLRPW